MVEHIKKVLIQEEGYSNRSAEITAADLSNIKDPEIARAFSQWLRNREKTNVSRGKFSCAQLMRCYDMKYPATLIFLDWYGEDPAAAVASISYGGG